MTDKLRHHAEAILRDWEAQADERDFRDPVRIQIKEDAAVLRAALAAAPQPAPTHECPVCGETVTWTGSDRPYCGECAADNGRDVKMRPIRVSSQPAPVDREALVEVIREAIRPGICDTIAERAADALLARGLRLPGDETLAWAVVGEDGAVVPGEIYEIKGCAEQIAEHHGERVVSVAIRVVEGGDDAA